MPDVEVNDALRFTKTQKFYMQTALDLVAARYEKQGEATHASACRMLANRVAAHQVVRRQPTAADGERWQQRLVEHSRDPEKCRIIIAEWWAELCAMAIDPIGAMVEGLLPMVDQAGMQTALQILVTLDQKITALVQDPSLPSDSSGPEVALSEIMRFVQHGQRQVQEGQPLWADDPHLRAIIEQIRSQSQPEL